MESRRPQAEINHEQSRRLPLDEQAAGRPPEERRSSALEQDAWYKRPMRRRSLIAASMVLLALFIYYLWRHYSSPTLSPVNNAILVPSEQSADPAAGDNGKIVMDRAEVDRLRAQAAANPRSYAAGARSASPQSASQSGNQPAHQFAFPQAAMPPPSPRDSQAALAPDGEAFAGNGRYQFYRQGNLTWRLDTDTGVACVIFATDEEWRKPKVYRRGCGSR